MIRGSTGYPVLIFKYPGIFHIALANTVLRSA